MNVAYLHNLIYLVSNYRNNGVLITDASGLDKCNLRYRINNSVATWAAQSSEAPGITGAILHSSPSKTDRCSWGVALG